MCEREQTAGILYFVASLPEKFRHEQRETYTKKYRDSLHDNTSREVLDKLLEPTTPISAVAHQRYEALEKAVKDVCDRSSGRYSKR